MIATIHARPNSTFEKQQIAVYMYVVAKTTANVALQHTPGTTTSRMGHNGPKDLV